ncbi:glycosyltransferase family 4 protein [Halopseudomonas aestusnigri]|uniref:Glycosyltransferase involved in cell wall bisynthesis n=1 Tax=Halopseudomonas aestusnigri TaxID=857252 RepID=A0AAQ1G8W4_9GAMM|nr:glycosyltransferase family 4 protein [Halopseudomonas aestusnigri]OWL86393.1 hypothetical protein B7O88_13690 [Halopseudomonas aestusnigri]SEG56737.1 Glycosyltransferase involved in cell wall bisynthesis [Halopseudomonas aestusnigri]
MNRKEEPVRVAFVLWAGKNFGGMERRYVRLASHLAERSQVGEIVLLARKGAELNVERHLNRNSGVRVLMYGRDREDDVSVFGGLRDALSLAWMIIGLKKYHIHFCCNPGVISSFFGGFLALRKQKSVSMVDITFALKINWQKKIHANLAVRLFSRIDCLSAEARNILKTIVGGSGGAHYKVAPCSFTDFSQVDISSRRDIDVLMLARFVENKGYDLLNSIKQDMAGLNVHLCGFGALKMDFEGFSIYETDEPLTVLGRTKIFLSLQSTNNYPSQSVLEAMASECAIIATDVGETRRFLDENCAVLIPYDSGALLQAIKKLLSDDDLRKRLGRKARLRVLEEHTVECYANYFKSEILGIDNSCHHRP